MLLEVLQKVISTHRFKVDAGHVLFVIVGHNYYSCALALAVWLKEHLSLFLEQCQRILVFHGHALKAAEKALVLYHIAFRNSHILFENLRRGYLVIAYEIKRLVDVSGAVPVEFGKVLAFVVVVKVVEHPLVCKKSSADVSPYFFVPWAFEVILCKNYPSPVKEKQLHFFYRPSCYLKKVHLILISFLLIS